MKKQKGITLVALVVTIIVLLILAGITVSLVLGERGLFNTARKLSRKTKNIKIPRRYRTSKNRSSKRKLRASNAR